MELNLWKPEKKGSRLEVDVVEEEEVEATTPPF